MIRVILVLIFCICSIVAEAQVSEDVVEKFAGPETYPAAALAVRATGKVAVAVIIDVNGEVVSATALSGHPLLRNASQQAALKWRFSKDFAATSKAADVHLTFNYQLGETRSIEKSEKESESVARNVYAPPLQIDVFGDILVPKLLLLPREYGEIKPEVCEIHSLPMQVETVEKSEQMSLRERENFYEIREEIFPNANIAAFVNFNDGVERREIHFCHICRAKREEWLQKNL